MIHAESSYDRPLRLVVPFFVLHLVSFFSLRSVQDLPPCLRLLWPTPARRADQHTSPSIRSALVASILLARLSRDKTLCGLLVTFILFNWSTGLV